MKKFFIIIFSLVCFSVQAKIKTSDCLTLETYFSRKRFFILDELNIPRKEIQWGKTQIVVLNEVNIDYPFATCLARKAIIALEMDATYLETYKKMYMENNGRNLIIELTFFNKKNKKMAVIASTFINDEECTLIFNGYLIVQREF